MNEHVNKMEMKCIYFTIFRIYINIYNYCSIVENKSLRFSDLKF